MTSEEVHAEIGRLVKELFASSDAPDTHLTIIEDGEGIEVVRARYNFGDPVERECDEGEGIKYTVLDPELGEDRGRGATILEALQNLDAELGTGPV